MNGVFEFLIYYIVSISLVAVILCIFDKYRAVKHGWRISEKALMTVSALGGGAAMYMTMRLIRHKTLHKKFMVGIPLIILIHIIIIGLLYSHFK